MSTKRCFSYTILALNMQLREGANAARMLRSRRVIPRPFRRPYPATHLAANCQGPGTCWVNGMRWEHAGYPGGFQLMPQTSSAGRDSYPVQTPVPLDAPENGGPRIRIGGPPPLRAVGRREPHPSCVFGGRVAPLPVCVRKPGIENAANRPTGSDPPAGIALVRSLVWRGSDPFDVAAGGKAYKLDRRDRLKPEGEAARHGGRGGQGERAATPR